MHMPILRLATFLFAAITALSPLTLAAQTSIEALLDSAIAGTHRSSANKARDVHRHPKETLLAMGLRPGMTVVEIWPDAGWFTEIVAPALRDNGRYVAAHYPLEHASTNRSQRESRVAFEAMLKGTPAAYGKAEISDLATPDRLAVAPPGTADLVLSFRSVHVWAYRGTDDIMFKAAFDALKPGGFLGVEDHRAIEGTSKQKQVNSGYMTESYVIAAAEKAGFKLDAKSEVNANPRDTKDYGKGVWALPPSLSYGEQDRAKYLAIGESDRMTLRFIKP